MRPDETRRGRPGGTTSGISTAIKTTTNSTAPEDRFCCSSLELFERETAARFSIFCGPGRCAREVLRGEGR